MATAGAADATAVASDVRGEDTVAAVHAAPGVAGVVAIAATAAVSAEFAAMGVPAAAAMTGVCVGVLCLMWPTVPSRLARLVWSLRVRWLPRRL